MMKIYERYKILAMLLIFVLVVSLLAACSDVLLTSDSRKNDIGSNQIYNLSAPQNLRYSDGVLKWSVVDNSSGYVVSVDGEEFSVLTNSFSLENANLSNGQHSASVRSVGSGSYKSSDFSEAISFFAQKNNGENYTEIYDNFGKSMALSLYEGNPVNDLALSNSININDKYYIYYFYLGAVNRSPVYVSSSVEYKYDIEVEMSFDKLTSESFSSQISKVTETIDTHSYTGGFEIGFEQEFSAGAGIVFVDASATFTTTQSTDHHWTNNWGTTESESRIKTDNYLSQYSEGLKLTLPFSESSGFRRGYSYRVSFYETVRTYGVLVYDATSTANNEYEKYTVAYQTFLQPDKTQVVIEESPDGYFDYVSNKTLTFDVDRAIELASQNVPTYDHVEPEVVEKKNDEGTVTFTTPSSTLRIDLSSYQETGNLSGFNYEFYNDGVLTINPAIDGKDIYRVEIIGAYNKKNKSGKTITNELENLSIVFADYWERDIELTIKDLAFKSKNNTSAISTNRNIMINVVGSNSITNVGLSQDWVIETKDLYLKGDGNAKLSIQGASGTDGLSGKNGINCGNLNIEKLQLTVSAGNGSNAADYEKVGGDGGIAVQCNDLSIVESNVTINGGNGGRGFDGKTSTKQEEHNEKRGSKGGNGGIGVVCQKLSYATNSSIAIYGGNGGNGGNGTKGTTATGASANGTNGGNGGDGAAALKISQQPNNSSSLVCQGGKKGVGGVGGAKGDGHWLTFGIAYGSNGESGSDGNDGKSIEIV